jgi:hypothetical protein
MGRTQCKLSKWIIWFIQYRIVYIKIGIWNVKRCKKREKLTNLENRDQPRGDMTNPGVSVSAQIRHPYWLSNMDVILLSLILLSMTFILDNHECPLSQSIYFIVLKMKWREFMTLNLDNQFRCPKSADLSLPSSFLFFYLERKIEDTELKIKLYWN